MKLTFSRITVITFVIYVATFLTVYLLKINPLVLQSEDILPNATVPFSILNEHNFNLDEYMPILKASYPNPDDKTAKPYYTVEVNGHYYSAFPMLTALLTTPLYIVPVALNINVDIETIRVMSRIGGAFITSLSVGVFFLILREKLKSIKLILLLTFIYAFASNSFAISSQGVWQHGTSQLILSLMLLSLLRQKYYLTGLLAGLAYWARPTNLLSTTMIFIFLMWKFIDDNNLNLKMLFSWQIIKSNILEKPVVIKQHDLLKLSSTANSIYSKLVKPKLYLKNLQPVLKYVIGTILGIFISMAFQTLVFGSVFNTAYGSAFEGFHTDLYHWFFGFLGLWVSPSKGILMISPIYVFIFYGFYKAFKSPKTNKLYFILAITIILHTVALGKWYSWFGGYSWGYRMANDVIPYMTFLLIPFVTSKYFKKRGYQIVFGLLVAYSTFMQFLGIIYFDGIWHTVFDGGWRNIDWLWSIKNSQPIFAFKRALFKVHILHSDPVQKGILYKEYLKTQRL